METQARLFKMIVPLPAGSAGTGRGAWSGREGRFFSRNLRKKKGAPGLLPKGGNAGFANNLQKRSIKWSSSLINWRTSDLVPLPGISF